MAALVVGDSSEKLVLLLPIWLGELQDDVEHVEIDVKPGEIDVESDEDDVGSKISLIAKRSSFIICYLLKGYNPVYLKPEIP